MHPVSETGAFGALKVSFAYAGVERAGRSAVAASAQVNRMDMPGSLGEQTARRGAIGTPSLVEPDSRRLSVRLVLFLLDQIRPIKNDVDRGVCERSIIPGVRTRNDKPQT